LCNEGDLESRLRKDRYFDEFRAEPIIKDIFEGLYYLSEKNVIHRDLKVANVFMHNSRAKIADFGFAKFTKYFIIKIDKNSRILTLGRPSICLRKVLLTIFTAPKQMYGLLGC